MTKKADCVNFVNVKRALQVLWTSFNTPVFSNSCI